MSNINRRQAVQIFLGGVPLAGLAVAHGAAGSAASTSSTDHSSSAPGTPTTAKLGSSVGIPYPFYGLNSGGNLGPFAQDTNTGKQNPFLPVFTDLGPSILRYPGGNSSGWFDLSNGLLLADPSVMPPPDQLHDFQTPPGFTLSALKTLLQAAAGPENSVVEASIVVNMLTYEQSQSQSPPPSLLTQMQQQIELLTSVAESLPITKIELGNELYLQGIHGTQYAQIYPCAKSYATAAKLWVKGLRSALGSSVELGVPVTLDVNSSDPRMSMWNKTVVDMLMTDIDALVAHNYLDPPNPPFSGTTVSEERTELAQNGSVPAIFSQVNVGIKRVVNLADMWPSLKIWNTETNFRDDVMGIANTWTHGLYAAYQLLAILEVPNIAQCLLHAVIGAQTEFSTIWTIDGNFPGGSTTQYKANTLSATGTTLKMLFGATRNKTSAQPLTFSTNPDQTGSNGNTAPSLYGWAFGSNAACIVLNLSPTAYALSFGGGSLFAGASYTQVSGDPIAFVGTPSNLVVTRGNFSAAMGLTLPAFSMTVLGG